MLRRCLLLGLCVALACGSIASAATSPLADAAMRGDNDAVKALLKQKADVHAAQGDGSTALHWAAHRDDVELANLLIAAGANLKAKTRLGDITPLQLAAKNGNVALIQAMLDAK